ncbi:unnamed protein product [Amoebophrya sp. A120]|nr:unnamed protein product [Amoebophrya sp. A120]|eukprot:GSA120T00023496001.1
MGLHPCKSVEEKSCNLVGAMCAQVPKKLFPRMTDGMRTKVGKKCNTNDITLGVPQQMPDHNCNARFLDMPYMMKNAVADFQGSVYTMIKSNYYLNAAAQLAGITKFPVDATPAQTVWGTAIHGKTGSWSMDSGTPEIYDHIYRVPQYLPGFPPAMLEKAIPKAMKIMAGELEYGYVGKDDTYICDSRDNPSQCALIGGDLWKCLKHYDAKKCHFCENAGDSLRCEVRGWNSHGEFWERVPIYPRDVLGEMFRDEWRDFYARPLMTQVDIPKSITRNVTNFKTLPWYMVQDAAPEYDLKSRMYLFPFAEATPTKVLMR